jgi:hypothetical protein
LQFHARPPQRCGRQKIGDDLANLGFVEGGDLRQRLNRGLVGFERERAAAQLFRRGQQRGRLIRLSERLADDLHAGGDGGGFPALEGGFVGGFQQGRDRPFAAVRDGAANQAVDQLPAEFHLAAVPREIEFDLGTVDGQPGDFQFQLRVEDGQHLTLKGGILVAGKLQQSDADFPVLHLLVAIRDGLGDHEAPATRKRIDVRANAQPALRVLDFGLPRGVRIFRSGSGGIGRRLVGGGSGRLLLARGQAQRETTAGNLKQNGAHARDFPRNRTDETSVKDGQTHGPLAPVRGGEGQGEGESCPSAQPLTLTLSSRRLGASGPTRPEVDCICGSTWLPRWPLESFGANAVFPPAPRDGKRVVGQTNSPKSPREFRSPALKKMPGFLGVAEPQHKKRGLRGPENRGKTPVEARRGDF